MVKFSKLFASMGLVVLAVNGACAIDTTGEEDTSSDADELWRRRRGQGSSSSGSSPTTGDAGTATDSGSPTVDASSPNDGSSPSGNSGTCATALAYPGYKLNYCTGYDTMADLGPYGFSQLGNGGISTTIVRSGAGSFKSVTQAGVSAGTRSEVQYAENESPLEGIIEWDVRYEQICQNNCHSLQFHPETAGGSASPGLWHIDGKFVLVNWKNGGNTQYPSGTPIEANKWYHMKLEYKFGTSGYMHLIIDGVLKINANNIQVGDGSGQYLKVGVNQWTNQPNSVTYYDNLRVYQKL
ncbi:MAG: heparin lyase I family protein [Polyangiaceae bacterium]